MALISKLLTTLNEDQSTECFGGGLWNEWIVASSQYQFTRIKTPVDRLIKVGHQATEIPQMVA